MVKILRTLDATSEWLARIFSWCLLAITIIIVVEVIRRYVFNSPTIYSWDINVMLLGAVVASGGAYNVLHEGHISIDILVSRLPARKKALLDVFLNLLAIPGFCMLLWKVAQNAWWSVLHQERYTSSLMPPIYPLKIVMTVGITLMLLQIIATLIRKLKIVITSKEVASK